MGKIYVFSDIHGCYETFQKLISRLSPLPEDDLLVFLGDYIDRGPDSRKVVEEIIRLGTRYRIITLMGNHEKMFLDSLSGGNDLTYYLVLGGKQTLASYGISEKDFDNIGQYLSSRHLLFFQNLLPYWENEKYIFVHAGLRPGVHLLQQSTRDLLWIRDEFIDSTYNFGKRIIFGHTPFSEPLVESNKIGIDTGAVYNGHLTCLILPDLEFVSVAGSKAWD